MRIKIYSESIGLSVTWDVSRARMGETQAGRLNRQAQAMITLSRAKQLTRAQSPGAWFYPPFLVKAAPEGLRILHS